MQEKIRRVAAYCRVSTDKADQNHSFENQKRYFREFIERNSKCLEIFDLCVFVCQIGRYMGIVGNGAAADNTDLHEKASLIMSGCPVLAV